MNKKNDFRLTESILPFWAKKLSPWHWVPLIREKGPLVCSQKRAQTLTTYTPIRYRPHRPLPGPKVQTARGNCSLNHTATSSTCVLSVTWWPQLSPLVPQAGLVTSFFFLISDVVFSQKLVHTRLTLSAFLGLCKWHLVFSGIICLKRESLKFCFLGGGVFTTEELFVCLFVFFWLGKLVQMCLTWPGFPEECPSSVCPKDSASAQEEPKSRSPAFTGSAYKGPPSFC